MRTSCHCCCSFFVQAEDGIGDSRVTGVRTCALPIWLRQPVAGMAGRRVALLLITANRGLCGAFNANLIREARARIEQLEPDAAVDLHLVGKKGVSYFKFTKRPVASQRIDIGDKPTAAHAAELVGPLMRQVQTC